MATQHLFLSDLENIEKKNLKGNYEILIVGTFNANIKGNSAPWFYGRPENEFWYLFPRMLEFPSMHPVDRNENVETLTKLWKQFCDQNKIVIVDIFKEVMLDLPNHSDANLMNLINEQFNAFEFKVAFENSTFDYVIFTWVGKSKNTLTNIKNDYIDYFSKKGSKIVQLITPSNAYSKPRAFKLNSWKEAYAK
jgi:hypothetical protein